MYSSFPIHFNKWNTFSVYWKKCNWTHYFILLAELYKIETVCNVYNMSGSVVWALQFRAEGERLLGPIQHAANVVNYLWNEYFVVVSPLCYTSVHAANLALVCALKGNQMLFWEFLNVCIKVVVGYWIFMSFSGNDFFKLTKTFAVVHLDCECRRGGRQGCAPVLATGNRGGRTSSFG